MDNVASHCAWHVAARAVLVLGMMRRSELRLAMASKAFGAKERRSMLRIRRVVGIVAAGTRHLVAAPPLARALAQLLHLADPARRQVCACANVIRQVGRDRVAGPIIKRRFP